MEGGIRGAQRRRVSVAVGEPVAGIPATRESQEVLGNVDAENPTRWADAVSHLLAQEPWSTADVDDLLTRSQAQPFKSGAPLGHDVWARIDRLELACRLVVELQHARASGRPEPFYARYPRCEGSRIVQRDGRPRRELLDHLAGALLEEPAHGELSTELPAAVQEWARGPLDQCQIQLSMMGEVVCGAHPVRRASSVGGAIATVSVLPGSSSLSRNLGLVTSPRLRYSPSRETGLFVICALVRAPPVEQRALCNTVAPIRVTWPSGPFRVSHQCLAATASRHLTYSAPSGL